ncbi:MAG: S1C family serine protease [Acidobacteriia bacterium]|nr:S1C family serine protease [Terriglobia bacterium]
MPNSLIQLSDEVAAIVESAGKSVVAIYGGGRIPSSGVHWKPGFIVTAEHSLRRDEDLKIGLPDGKIVAAELAGRDPGSDLALLKFDAGDVPVIVTTNAAPRTGDLIVAVGRHREIGTCAALGIVSVLGPGWNTWRGGRVDQFIRLDVALYPGSSGAAIVNSSGEALGVATSVLSRIAPVAVPRVTVDRVATELAKRGRVARGYLGVGLQPVPLPEELGSAGMIVLSVEKKSPAANAGLVVGDILVAIDGRPVKDTADVQAFLFGDSIGKTFSTTIVRGGQRTELAGLTIGEK